MKHYFRSCNHLLIAALLFFQLAIAKAQTDTVGEIQGIILDGNNDKPMEKALVKIIENNYADVSDKNGLFSIHNLPYSNYTLEVSYLGFKTNTTRVNVNQNIIKGIIIHLYPFTIETSAVVVTGSHHNSEFDDMNEFINVLKGKELEREIGLTLASTLKNETGLSIRSMGPAPARPVIRGLGNDRIQITEDGIQSTDLSSTSPDHAVAIEPFTIERIEVIRGPKILTQNSTTIGGIVNIVREEIPIEIPASFTGNFGIYGESVNKGYLGSVVIKLPIYNFVVRGEVSRRNANNLSTPIGQLKNSELITENFSIGTGYIDSWGNTGISLREYSSEYGIPGGFVGAHPNGVDVKIFKRQLNAKTKLKLSGNIFEELSFDFARDYFRQTEYERKYLIGAEFTIFNYRGQLELLNKNILLFEKGSSGLSFEYRDFKVGGFVFTAPTRSLKTSLFCYQSASFRNTTLDGAFRISYDELIPRKENPSSKNEFIVSRNFITYSLSISLFQKLNENIVFGGNLSRSSRVPTIEELYSEGPHLAAYSYEIGNPKLEYERGFGSELFISYKNNFLSSVLTFFLNELDYYIIPRNSGRINFQTLLPVYQTEGVEASFRGVETSHTIQLNENFFVDASASYTFGEIKNSNSPLPQIPPLKTMIELRYIKGNIGLGLNSEIASSQNRVDLFELPTSGYSVFGAFAQYSLVTGIFVHNFSFVVENIFNKEYRNHLSRVKIILPEAGRNFRLTYRIYF